MTPETQQIDNWMMKWETIYDECVAIRIIDIIGSRVGILRCLRCEISIWGDASLQGSYTKFSRLSTDFEITFKNGRTRLISGCNSDTRGRRSSLKCIC